MKYETLVRMHFVYCCFWHFSFSKIAFMTYDVKEEYTIWEFLWYLPTYIIAWCYTHRKRWIIAKKSVAGDETK